MRDASSVDRVRRTLLLTAPLALSACLLGCTRPQPALGDPAGGLAAALTARDRSAFLSRFASGAGPQALAARVYANLSRRDATARPTPRIVSSGLDRLLVSWGYPDEAEVHSVAGVRSANGLITDLAPLSTGTEWLADVQSVRTEPRLTVVAPDESVLTQWWTAALAGLSALASVAPQGLRSAGPLLVLVPTDVLAFGRYAGAGADRVAAVTVVPGSADSLGFRVVVNPRTLEDRDAAATITHEAVHAAMGSPRLTATPGWLLEGIAESLTARAHRFVADANRALAREAIASGLPSSLPDTGTGDPGSYALAELAVGAMVQQIGWAAVLDEARRRSGTSGRIDDRQILTWYRDSLAGLG